MARFQAYRDTLGDEVFDKISSSSILVVGAGGIGCELVKNLVMSGFMNIEIIDLDTIDVSNLNRQFLFRMKHVGMSKAQVAREAALEFNPHANIVAHHANIKSSDFGTDYFKRFDLVLNALDNIDARRHVNRLCIACDVPLIESGTTGYLGQTTVIKKGVTECYECRPKPAQKVYPICTIRSTPDKPVHCIVYAKEALKLLFGNTNESMLFEDISVGASAYMDKVTPPSEMVTATEVPIDQLLSYAENVIRGLYNRDVQSKIEMNVYKAATSKPIPLPDDLLGQGIDLARACLRKETAKPSSATGWERLVWSAEQCVCEFSLCLVEIWTARRSLLGSFEFDKDDQLAMRFVCAASNLRAHVFHIAKQTFYDCKGVAGNIIPAIATTNAIVAGLQVLEAFKILAREKPIQDACKYTYCLRIPTRKGLYLQPSTLEPPKASCFVCNPSQRIVHINTHTWTLAQFVSSVLKQRLAFNEPSIVKGTSLIYEEGEDADEDLFENLNKILANLPAGGLKDGAMLMVTDQTQTLTVNITITHCEQFDEDTEAEGFRITGQADTPPIPNPATPMQTEEKKENVSESPEDDDFLVVLGSAKHGEAAPKDVTNDASSQVMVLDDTPGDVPVVSAKRRRDANGDSDIPAAKKTVIDLDD